MRRLVTSLERVADRLDAIEQQLQALKGVEDVLNRLGRAEKAARESAGAQEAFAADFREDMQFVHTTTVLNLFGCLVGILWGCLALMRK